MKTLYIECSMGAAGDMLMAALMELCPEPDKFIEKMNEIGLKNTVVRAVKTERNGICGNSIEVLVNGMLEDEHRHDQDHKHNHTSMDDIASLIRSLRIPENVKEKTLEVYSILSEAEAHVHARPAGDIHFHEVGTLDAVCDIAGCCLALDIISPVRIIVSPVHVGSGSIECRHGRLPVPAPATAYILRGIPVYGGEIKGELCTPTGAALLKSFAGSFGSMPVMNVEKIGYGMGKRDYGHLNCVRAFLGEAEIKENKNIYELSCNLDDITAEELAFSYDKLFEAGALDVFVIPIVMKKGRAGYILTAFAYEKDKDIVAKTMLKHTTTRGLRILLCDERISLGYRNEKLETEYGSIDIKVSSGYGITKAKPEYDSVAAAAKKHGATFAQVQKSALDAFKKSEKY